MLDAINVKYWEMCHSSEDLGVHRDNDYNARCDVCGDSKKRKKLKRLHLYKKSSYENDSIKCMNCNATFTMYSYLKKQHTHLLAPYIQETSINTLNTLNSFKPISIDSAIKIEEVKKVEKTNKLFTFERPKELISPNSEVASYIKSRGFTREILKHHKIKLFLSKGMVSLGKGKEVNLKDYIVIPLVENEKWYGFYSRSIHNKIFYTYIPEENTGYKVWNYFDVNRKDTVYIFEAIFNALSTSLNSIACLGSDIDSERLKELKEPVFCFDNDATGREKALKYAKMGYKVFIYPDYITQKDFNDILKEGMTVESIDNLITSNIYQGIMAITKLTLQM
jgi:hypothetical protein